MRTLAVGYEVENPEDYAFGERDVVIIAIFSQRAVAAVRKMLLERGCHAEKIYSFSEPKQINEIYS